MAMNPLFVFAAVTILALCVMILTYKALIRLAGMVIIPNNGVGIVTKKFGLGGKRSNLPDGKLIALNGEAGIQADTLSPGLHFGLFPWQYSVRVEAFTRIDEGKIGVVEARD